MEICEIYKPRAEDAGMNLCGILLVCDKGVQTC